MAFYNFNGNAISTAYRFDGSPIVEGDYSVASSDYQRAILQARDALAEDYREKDAIPLVIYTDTHSYLNSAHKATFDYLALATKASEMSAYLNLGDVCGDKVNSTALNDMANCLSAFPRTKQINVEGNHDVYKTGPITDTSGVERSYDVATASEFESTHTTYFDNSSYGSNHHYYLMGNETMVDVAHSVRYCIFASFVFTDLCYYHYYVSSEVAEAIITMLSMTDYDLVVLSHIGVADGSQTFTSPAVDGNTESTSTTGVGGYNDFSFNCSLNQLLVDRKNKASGTFTDSDGGTHAYDFTSCTTDLLCCLHGHEHADSWCKIGGVVPSIGLDAYRYDNHPLYMADINRSASKVNIWKFDEANNVYNYSVPL